jgi:WD40 repeat protein
MAATFDYDVFVSYRHHQLDSDVTARLQDELQRFSRPWYRPLARTLRVFRDQTNLAASPDLWGAIEDAMAASRWLLVIASPRSAQSPRVRRELEWWRERRGAATICIALTDGELQWDESANDFDWHVTTALSREALGRAFDSEPTWIDLRPLTVAGSAAHRGLLRRFTRSLTDPRLQDAAASLIAQVKGVPKDTLIGEHLRRNRQFTRAIMSTLLILVLLLAASITAASIAAVQRDRAVHQATISEAGLLAALGESLTSSDLDLAELFAAEAYKLYPDSQTRAALFQAVTADPYLVRYLQATGTISAIAGSAQAATAVAGTAGGDVLRWDLTDFKRALVERLPATVASVAVSADGDTIAATSSSAARIWVRGHGVQSVPIPSGWTVSAAAVSPSGQYVALSVTTAGSQPAYFLLLGHERAGRLTVRRVPVPDPASSLSFSGETQLVLADIPDSAWERLAVPSLAEISTGRAGFGAQLYATALSPTGKFISVANGGPPLPVWTTSDVSSSALIYPPASGARETAGIYPDALAISTDGRRVAYADSGTIYVSDITAFGDTASSPLLSLSGNNVINPNDLTFLGPGHSELLSASGDLLTLWNLNQYSRISVRAPAQLPMGCAACGGAVVSVSPKENYAIVTAGGYRTLTAVGLPVSAGYSHMLSPSTSPAHVYGPVVWSRDGQHFYVFMLSASGGGVWSAAGRPAFQQDWVTPRVTDAKLNPENNPALSAALTPSGRQILEIDSAGNIILRDSATGAAERVTHGSPGYFAMIDQEGDYEVSISEAPAGQVRITDLKTGSTMPLPGGPASEVAYDGELLLIARSAGTIEVRSADGRNLIRSFVGIVNPETGPVAASASMVVELSLDGDIVVFDLSSGQEIGSIALPASPQISYTGIAFSPDGNTLVTATPSYGGSEGPGEVTEWDFSPTTWSQIACATAGHRVTEGEWQEYVGSGEPSMPAQVACG